MIKFFRKIRRNLLSEGKTGKYFKYAIGEIVLVMIGILLALQVNTWNEEIKERNIEQEYLTDLLEEMNYNFSELERVMLLNQKNNEAAMELIKYTGPQKPVISEKLFETLIFRAMQREVQYRPNSGVIDEIISSGKLSIFESKKIRKIVSSWSGLMLRVRFQEGELNGPRMDLLKIMNVDGNMKNAVSNVFGDAFEFSKSKFKSSNLSLLQSNRFENKLVGFIGTSKFLNSNYYTKLKKEILNSIQLIESGIVID